MNKEIFIKELWQDDDKTLSIKWTDETKQNFDVVNLRKVCPCALCVDESTGKRKKAAAEIVADSIRPNTISSVGQYAISIHFSDGHKTGIYTYNYLRSLNNETDKK